MAPENSCGSYVYAHNGTTIYQSKCSLEYVAFYEYGGQQYMYNSSYSAGQAGGENFCAAHPWVYSCTHPPFEWCEVDPCCSGPHSFHEQTFGGSC